jgi:hypothetical protein
LLNHRVRGGLVECVECGDRHPYRRRRGERGASVCRRCGHRAYRRGQAASGPHPFGPVSKASLLRRFRITERTLDRILTFPLPTPTA